MRVWLLVVPLVLLFVPPARANTVDESLGKMADDIKRYADAKSIKEVRIEGFRGVGEFVTSGGPYLVEKLTGQLKKRQIDVVLKSRLILSGEYDEVEDRDTQTQAVRLKITLKDREEDKEIALERRYVKNQTELARVLGLTVEFPPEADRKDRNRELKKQIDQPKPAIQGSVLRARADSKFALEILVKHGDGYTPRAPVEKAQTGLAFVGIKRDEIYAVRLINDNPFDVAVLLTLDGLSLFIACEDTDPVSKQPLRDPLTRKPLFQHVVVPKNSAVIIKGWFVNLKQSDEFKVTAYANSLADLFKSTGDVGTITAEFHAAVPAGENFPAGEPKSGDQVAQSADATGRGKRFDQEYGVVDLKLGGLRAALSIRYTR